MCCPSASKQLHSDRSIMLQYIESIPILYVQLGQTVDCCTHVHIAAKVEESASGDMSSTSVFEMSK